MANFCNNYKCSIAFKNHIKFFSLKKNTVLKVFDTMPGI